MKSDNGKHYNLTMLFLIAVSIFGLFLSLFFVVYPPNLEEDFAFRNLTVGSVFCAICVLGIFAAVFPSSCSAIPSFGKRNESDKSNFTIHGKTLQAHHLSCENYSTHILRIGSKKFCATCFGLLVGASAVLIGTSLYFFGNLRIGEPFTLVSVGAFAVSFGLLQSALPKFSNGSTRFFASTIFVIGCFLMLVSLDERVKSTLIDLFFAALCILWIVTKIAFSQWDHQQTCLQCSNESCREDKKRMR
jgi:hypothetical protein